MKLRLPWTRDEARDERTPSAPAEDPRCQTHKCPHCVELERQRHDEKRLVTVHPSVQLTPEAARRIEQEWQDRGILQ